MNSKASVLQQAEELIKPLASQHVPKEGTQVEAIIDQWLHAVATDSQFFTNPAISEPSIIKNEVITTLKAHGLYESRLQFWSEVFEHLPLKTPQEPSFRFIDLFAGIGGVRLGFQKVGGACVFSSEFDKHAQQTYKNNHGEIPFGDITYIEPTHIPDHEVLLAGFPCQPFSHAGLKLGIEDTRGTLFHNIARIIEEKQPKFALLENVKGLVSHDKGYTLKVILKTLTDIGYSCNISKDLIESGTAKQIQIEAKKMILKSVDFGVPQNRQRIYIVLWKDGLIDTFKYPEPLRVATRVSDILGEEPCEKLTISDRLWAGHQRRKIENKAKGKGFGYGLVTPESEYTNTISARYYKDGSEILLAQKGKNPRKISTREAARLQGFPDDFLPSKSNTQAYKQFGNSVTVPVIYALASQIKKSME
ncbi:DNA cytosine methyltransferase [Vibrio breoganii]|uniref:DNA cytosine methyltransferase n=1 Tax=Vibrio breoganii TaxID=553239 RepID=UPI000C85844C|nr:DNA cytosine methyltransferase [Vibrio breoganii]PMI22499.1 DNA (cytosine-5-)-methyltransferase [Vibrio breoganii]PML37686.1 DNA (cytosine-5-)-methyltransferase [Vibrio breoganii]PMO74585.1 DNA (cytosine-5-)-methyltransferase [Vibrio breoganii]PMO93434.1 DNA (cytosine-5-)-methyltransferase [Vibrio breoganii]PMP04544.1 DNA (cytosine-5-)-methyltransferase [Vibrio breoganii]